MMFVWWLLLFWLGDLGPKLYPLFPPDGWKPSSTFMMEPLIQGLCGVDATGCLWCLCVPCVILLRVTNCWSVFCIGMVTSRQLQCCWMKVRVLRMWRTTMVPRHCTSQPRMAWSSSSSCCLLTKKLIWSVAQIQLFIYLLWKLYSSAHKTLNEDAAYKMHKWLLTHRSISESDKVEVQTAALDIQ